MRTILYVSALTLALSSPALAEMHDGGGGGGGHGGGGHAASHMGGSGGAHIARGGERGGHGHGGRFFGGGVGYACTPLQVAAGYCGYGY
jgi:hypothetical protein